MTKNECEKCGRDDGHWIGCPETTGATEPYDRHGGKEWNPLGETMKALTCSFDGCSELRRSVDKRVKFCETHSDPKNRK